jgi:hypothetical protein
LLSKTGLGSRLPPNTVADTSFSRSKGNNRAEERRRNGAEVQRCRVDMRKFGSLKTCKTEDTFHWRHEAGDMKLKARKAEDMGVERTKDEGRGKGLRL